MRNKVPGPGSYTASIQPVIKRPPTAVMGRDTRGNNFAGLKNAPGPGAYTGKVEDKNKAPSYSFGKERPHTAYSEGPGPGAYRIPCSFGTLPKYALPSTSEFAFI